MSTRGLVDTNIVILRGRLAPGSLPDEPVISAITQAELSIGPLLADDLSVAAARLAHLHAAERDCIALPFDSECARAYARVAAELRKSGRKSAARAFDALIASTAIAHDLPLYTTNPADFQGIPELDLRPVEP